MRAGTVLCVILAAAIPAGTAGGNAAGGTKSAESRKQSLGDVETLAQGNAAFGLDLYKELSSREGNLSFSPYSISLALGMTYAAARENTANEMAKTLHFSLSQEKLHPAFFQLQTRLYEIEQRGNVVLDVANALWPQRGHPFLKEYMVLLRKHYAVFVRAVDYETDAGRETARRVINTWVSDKTKGKLTELIQPEYLQQDTRLVLTNAIYFSGRWRYQFDSKDTNDAPFHLSPEKSVQAPTMHQKRQFRYTETEVLQIVELPYRAGEISMLVLLPKKIDGLKETEASLSVENLRQWRDQLKPREVAVHLPKFTMTLGVPLKEVLEKMGTVEAFKPGAANFAGMDGSNWFYISEVIHKAFIDVDEEGTEAATASGAYVGMIGSPPPPAVFRADHPFLFLIQENRTGAILFLGRVTDPTGAVAKGD